MGFNIQGMDECMAQIFYDFISFQNQTKIDNFNFHIHDKSSLKPIRNYFLDFVKKLKELVQTDNVEEIISYNANLIFNRIYKLKLAKINLR